MNLILPELLSYEVSVILGASHFCNKNAGFSIKFSLQNRLLFVTVVMENFVITVIGPNVTIKLIVTSWADARVKLHFQVHLGSKKVLGQKNEGSNKFWIQKNFGYKNLLNQLNLSLMALSMDLSQLDLS